MFFLFERIVYNKIILLYFISISNRIKQIIESDLQLWDARHAMYLKERAITCVYGITGIALMKK